MPSPLTMQSDITRSSTAYSQAESTHFDALFTPSLGNTPDTISDTVSISPIGMPIDNDIVRQKIMDGLTHTSVQSTLPADCQSSQCRQAVYQYLEDGIRQLSQKEVQLVRAYLTHLTQPSTHHHLGLTPTMMETIYACIDSLPQVSDSSLKSLSHSTKHYMETSLGISPQEAKFRQNAYKMNPKNPQLTYITHALYQKGTLTQDMSDTEVAAAVLNYVQTNYRYQADVCDGVKCDHWQTVSETLNKGQGDCEDLSILTASLLTNVLTTKRGYSHQQAAQMVSLSAGYVASRHGTIGGHVLVKFRPSQSTTLALDATSTVGPFEFKKLQFDELFEFNDRVFQTYQTIDENFTTALAVDIPIFLKNSSMFGFDPNNIPDHITSVPEENDVAYQANHNSLVWQINNEISQLLQFIKEPFTIPKMQDGQLYRKAVVDTNPLYDEIETVVRNLLPSSVSGDTPVEHVSSLAMSQFSDMQKVIKDLKKFMTDNNWRVYQSQYNSQLALLIQGLPPETLVTAEMFASPSGTSSDPRTQQALQDELTLKNDQKFALRQQAIDTIKATFPTMDDTQTNNLFDKVLEDKVSQDASAEIKTVVTQITTLVTQYKSLNTDTEEITNKLKVFNDEASRLDSLLESVYDSIKADIKPAPIDPSVGLPKLYRRTATQSDIGTTVNGVKVQYIGQLIEITNLSKAQYDAKSSKKALQKTEEQIRLKELEIKNTDPRFLDTAVKSELTRLKKQRDNLRKNVTEIYVHISPKDGKYPKNNAGESSWTYDGALVKGKKEKFKFFDIVVHQQPEVKSQFGIPMKDSIVQTVVMNEKAFFSYIMKTRQHLNKIALLFHMGNGLLEHQLFESRDIHDSYMDGGQKQGADKIRQKSDKTTASFTKAFNGFQSKVSDGVNQMSSELFSFIESSNEAIFKRKEYEIESWARNFNILDNPGLSFVAGFIFGAGAEFVDELTGEFSLLRAKAHEQLAKIKLSTKFHNTVARNEYLNLVTVGGKVDGQELGGINLWTTDDRLNRFKEIRADLTPDQNRTELHFGPHVWRLLEDTHAINQQAQVPRSFSKDMITQYIQKLGEPLEYDIHGRVTTQSFTSTQNQQFNNLYFQAFNNSQTPQQPTASTDSHASKTSLYNVSRNRPYGMDIRDLSNSPLFHRAGGAKSGDLITKPPGKTDPGQPDNPLQAFLQILQFDKIAKGLMTPIKNAFGPAPEAFSGSYSGFIDYNMEKQIEFRHRLLGFQNALFLALMIKNAIMSKRRDAAKDISGTKSTSASSAIQNLSEQALSVELTKQMDAFESMHQQALGLTSAVNALIKTRMTVYKTNATAILKKTKIAANLILVGAAKVASGSLATAISSGMAIELAPKPVPTPAIFTFLGAGLGGSNPLYWNDFFMTMGGALIEQLSASFESGIEASAYEYNIPNIIQHDDTLMSGINDTSSTINRGGPQGTSLYANAYTAKRSTQYQANAQFAQAQNTQEGSILNATFSGNTLGGTNQLHRYYSNTLKTLHLKSRLQYTQTRTDLHFSDGYGAFNIKGVPIPVAKTPDVAGDSTYDYGYSFIEGTGNGYFKMNHLLNAERQERTTYYRNLIRRHLTVLRMLYDAIENEAAYMFGKGKAGGMQKFSSGSYDVIESVLKVEAATVQDLQTEIQLLLDALNQNMQKENVMLQKDFAATKTLFEFVASFSTLIPHGVGDPVNQLAQLGIDTVDEQRRLAFGPFAGLQSNFWEEDTIQKREKAFTKLTSETFINKKTFVTDGGDPNRFLKKKEDYFQLLGAAYKDAPGIQRFAGSIGSNILNPSKEFEQKMHAITPWFVLEELERDALNVLYQNSSPKGMLEVQKTTPIKDYGRTKTKYEGIDKQTDSFLEFKEIQYDTVSEAQKRLNKVFTIRMFLLMIENAIYQQRQNILRDMFGVSSSAGIIDAAQSMTDTYNATQLNILNDITNELTSRVETENEYRTAEIDEVLTLSVTGLMLPLAQNQISLAASPHSSSSTKKMLQKTVKSTQRVMILKTVGQLVVGLIGLLTVKPVPEITSEMFDIESSTAEESTDEDRIKELKGNNQSEDQTAAKITGTTKPTAPSSQGTGKEPKINDQAAGTHGIGKGSTQGNIQFSRRGQFVVNRGALARSKAKMKRKFRKLQLLTQILTAMQDATTDSAAELSGVSSSKAFKGISGIVSKVGSLEQSLLESTTKALEASAAARNRFLSKIKESSQGLVQKGISKRIGKLQAKLKSRRKAGKRQHEQYKDAGTKLNKKSRAKLALKKSAVLSKTLTFLDKTLLPLASMKLVDASVNLGHADDGINPDDGVTITGAEATEGDTAGGSGDAGFAGTAELEDAVLQAQIDKQNTAIQQKLLQEDIQEIKALSSGFARFKNHLYERYKKRAQKQLEETRDKIDAKILPLIDAAMKNPKSQQAMQQIFEQGATNPAQSMKKAFPAAISQVVSKAIPNPIDLIKNGAQQVKTKGSRLKGIGKMAGGLALGLGKVIGKILSFTAKTVGKILLESFRLFTGKSMLIRAGRFLNQKADATQNKVGKGLLKTGALIFGGVGRILSPLPNKKLLVSDTKLGKAARFGVAAVKGIFSPILKTTNLIGKATNALLEAPDKISLPKKRHFAAMAHAISSPKETASKIGHSIKTTTLNAVDTLKTTGSNVGHAILTPKETTLKAMDRVKQSAQEKLNPAIDHTKSADFKEVMADFQERMTKVEKLTAERQAKKIRLLTAQGESEEQIKDQIKNVKATLKQHRNINTIHATLQGLLSGGLSEEERGKLESIAFKDDPQDASKKISLFKAIQTLQRNISDIDISDLSHSEALAFAKDYQDIRMALIKSKLIKGEDIADLDKADDEGTSKPADLDKEDPRKQLEKQLAESQKRINTTQAELNELELLKAQRANEQQQREESKRQAQDRLTSLLGGSPPAEVLAKLNSQLEAISLKESLDGIPDTAPISQSELEKLAQYEAARLQAVKDTNELAQLTDQQSTLENTLDVLDKKQRATSTQQQLATDKTRLNTLQSGLAETKSTHATFLQSNIASQLSTIRNSRQAQQQLQLVSASFEEKRRAENESFQLGLEGLSAQQSQLTQAKEARRQELLSNLPNDNVIKRSLRTAALTSIKLLLLDKEDTETRNVIESTFDKIINGKGKSTTAKIILQGLLRDQSKLTLIDPKTIRLLSNPFSIDPNDTRDATKSEEEILALAAQLSNASQQLFTDSNKGSGRGKHTSNTRESIENTQAILKEISGLSAADKRRVLQAFHIQKTLQQEFGEREEKLATVSSKLNNRHAQTLASLQETENDAKKQLARTTISSQLHLSSLREQRLQATSTYTQQTASITEQITALSRKIVPQEAALTALRLPATDSSTSQPSLEQLQQQHQATSDQLAKTTATIEAIQSRLTAFKENTPHTQTHQAALAHNESVQQSQQRREELQAKLAELSPIDGTTSKEKIEKKITAIRQTQSELDALSADETPSQDEVQLNAKLNELINKIEEKTTLSQQQAKSHDKLHQQLRSLPPRKPPKITGSVPGSDEKKISEEAKNRLKSDGKLVDSILAKLSGNAVDSQLNNTILIDLFQVNKGDTLTAAQQISASAAVSEAVYHQSQIEKLQFLSDRPPEDIQNELQIHQQNIEKIAQSQGDLLGTNQQFDDLIDELTVLKTRLSESSAPHTTSVEIINKQIEELSKLKQKEEEQQASQFQTEKNTVRSFDISNKKRGFTAALTDFTVFSLSVTEDEQTANTLSSLYNTSFSERNAARKAATGFADSTYEFFSPLKTRRNRHHFDAFFNRLLTKIGSSSSKDTQASAASHIKKLQNTKGQINRLTKVDTLLQQHQTISDELLQLTSNDHTVQAANLVKELIKDTTVGTEAATQALFRLKQESPQQYQKIIKQLKESSHTKDNKTAVSRLILDIQTSKGVDDIIDRDYSKRELTHSEKQTRRNLRNKFGTHTTVHFTEEDGNRSTRLKKEEAENFIFAVANLDQLDLSTPQIKSKIKRLTSAESIKKQYINKIQRSPDTDPLSRLGKFKKTVQESLYTKANFISSELKAFSNSDDVTKQLLAQQFVDTLKHTGVNTDFLNLTYDTPASTEFKTRLKATLSQFADLPPDMQPTSFAGKPPNELPTLKEAQQYLEKLDDIQRTDEMNEHLTEVATLIRTGFRQGQDDEVDALIKLIPTTDSATLQKVTALLPPSEQTQLRSLPTAQSPAVKAILDSSDVSATEILEELSERQKKQKELADEIRKAADFFASASSTEQHAVFGTLALDTDTIDSVAQLIVQGIQANNATTIDASAQLVKSLDTVFENESVQHQAFRESLATEVQEQLLRANETPTGAIKKTTLDQFFDSLTQHNNNHKHDFETWIKSGFHLQATAPTVALLKAAESMGTHIRTLNTALSPGSIQRIEGTRDALIQLGLEDPTKAARWIVDLDTINSTFGPNTTEAALYINHMHGVIQHTGKTIQRHSGNRLILSRLVQLLSTTRDMGLEALGKTMSQLPALKQDLESKLANKLLENESDSEIPTLQSQLALVNLVLESQDKIGLANQQLIQFNRSRLSFDDNLSESLNGTKKETPLHSALQTIQRLRHREPRPETKEITAALRQLQSASDIMNDDSIPAETKASIAIVIEQTPRMIQSPGLVKVLLQPGSSEQEIKSQIELLQLLSRSNTEVQTALANLYLPSESPDAPPQLHPQASSQLDTVIETMQHHPLHSHLTTLQILIKNHSKPESPDKKKAMMTKILTKKSPTAYDLKAMLTSDDLKDIFNKQFLALYPDEQKKQMEILAQLLPLAQTDDTMRNFLLSDTAHIPIESTVSNNATLREKVQFILECQLSLIPDALDSATDDSAHESIIKRWTKIASTMASAGQKVPLHPTVKEALIRTKNIGGLQPTLEETHTLAELFQNTNASDIDTLFNTELKDIHETYQSTTDLAAIITNTDNSDSMRLSALSQLKQTHPSNYIKLLVNTPPDALSKLHHSQLYADHQLVRTYSSLFTELAGAGNPEKITQLLPNILKRDTFPEDLGHLLTLSRSLGDTAQQSFVQALKGYRPRLESYLLANVLAPPPHLQGSSPPDTPTPTKATFDSLPKEIQTKITDALLESGLLDTSSHVSMSLFDVSSDPSSPTHLTFQQPLTSLMNTLQSIQYDTGQNVFSDSFDMGALKTQLLDFRQAKSQLLHSLSTAVSSTTFESLSQQQQQDSVSDIQSIQTELKHQALSHFSEMQKTAQKMHEGLIKDPQKEVRGDIKHLQGLLLASREDVIMSLGKDGEQQFNTAIASTGDTADDIHRLIVLLHGLKEKFTSSPIATKITQTKQQLQGALTQLIITGNHSLPTPEAETFLKTLLNEGTFSPTHPAYKALKQLATTGNIETLASFSTDQSLNAQLLGLAAGPLHQTDMTESSHRDAVETVAKDIAEKPGSLPIAMTTIPTMSQDQQIVFINAYFHAFKDTHNGQLEPFIQLLQTATIPKETLQTMDAFQSLTPLQQSYVQFRLYNTPLDPAYQDSINAFQTTEKQQQDDFLTNLEDPTLLSALLSTIANRGANESNTEEIHHIFTMLYQHNPTLFTPALMDFIHNPNFSPITTTLLGDDFLSKDGENRLSLKSIFMQAMQQEDTATSQEVLSALLESPVARTSKGLQKMAYLALHNPDGRPRELPLTSENTQHYSRVLSLALQHKSHPSEPPFSHIFAVKNYVSSDPSIETLRNQLLIHVHFNLSTLHTTYTTHLLKNHPKLNTLLPPSAPTKVNDSKEDAIDSQPTTIASQPTPGAFTELKEWRTLSEVDKISKAISLIKSPPSKDLLSMLTHYPKVSKEIADTLYTQITSGRTTLLEISPLLHRFPPLSNAFNALPSSKKSTITQLFMTSLKGASPSDMTELTPLATHLPFLQTPLSEHLLNKESLTRTDLQLLIQSQQLRKVPNLLNKLGGNRGQLLHQLTDTSPLTSTDQMAIESLRNTLLNTLLTSSPANDDEFFNIMDWIDSSQTTVPLSKKQQDRISKYYAVIVNNHYKTIYPDKTGHIRKNARHNYAKRLLQTHTLSSPVKEKLLNAFLEHPFITQSTPKSTSLAQSLDTMQSLMYTLHEKRMPSHQKQLMGNVIANFSQAHAQELGAYIKHTNNSHKFAQIFTHDLQENHGLVFSTVLQSLQSQSGALKSLAKGIIKISSPQIKTALTTHYHHALHQPDTSANKAFLAFHSEYLKEAAAQNKHISEDYRALIHSPTVMKVDIPALSAALPQLPFKSITQLHTELQPYLTENKVNPETLNPDQPLNLPPQFMPMEPEIRQLLLSHVDRSVDVSTPPFKALQEAGFIDDDGFLTRPILQSVTQPELQQVIDDKIPNTLAATLQMLGTINKDGMIDDNQISQLTPPLPRLFIGDASPEDERLKESTELQNKLLQAGIINTHGDVLKDLSKESKLLTALNINETSLTQSEVLKLLQSHKQTQDHLTKVTGLFPQQRRQLANFLHERAENKRKDQKTLGERDTPQLRQKLQLTFTQQNMVRQIEKDHHLPNGKLYELLHKQGHIQHGQLALNPEQALDVSSLGLTPKAQQELATDLRQQFTKTNRHRSHALIAMIKQTNGDLFSRHTDHIKTTTTTKVSRVDQTIRTRHSQNYLLSFLRESGEPGAELDILNHFGEALWSDNKNDVTLAKKIIEQWVSHSSITQLSGALTSPLLSPMAKQGLMQRIIDLDTPGTELYKQTEFRDQRVLKYGFSRPHKMDISLSERPITTHKAISKQESAQIWESLQTSSEDTPALLDKNGRLRFDENGKLISPLTEETLQKQGVPDYAISHVLDILRQTESDRVIGHHTLQTMQALHSVITRQSKPKPVTKHDFTHAALPTIYRDTSNTLKLGLYKGISSNRSKTIWGLLQDKSVITALDDNGESHINPVALKQLTKEMLMDEHQFNLREKEAKHVLAILQEKRSVPPVALQAQLTLFATMAKASTSHRPWFVDNHTKTLNEPATELTPLKTFLGRTAITGEDAQHIKKTLREKEFKSIFDKKGPLTADNLTAIVSKLTKNTDKLLPLPIIMSEMKLLEKKELLPKGTTEKFIQALKAQSPSGSITQWVAQHYPNTPRHILAAIPHAIAIGADYRPITDINVDNELQWAHSLETDIRFALHKLQTDAPLSESDLMAINIYQGEASHELQLQIEAASHLHTVLTTSDQKAFAEAYSQLFEKYLAPAPSENSFQDPHGLIQRVKEGPNASAHGSLYPRIHAQLNRFYGDKLEESGDIPKPSQKDRSAFFKLLLTPPKTHEELSPLVENNYQLPIKEQKLSDDESGITHFGRLKQHDKPLRQVINDVFKAHENIADPNENIQALLQEIWEAIAAHRKVPSDDAKGDDTSTELAKPPLHAKGDDGGDDGPAPPPTKSSEAGSGDSGSRHGDSPPKPPTYASSSDSDGDSSGDEKADDPHRVRVGSRQPLPPPTSASRHSGRSADSRQRIILPPIADIRLSDSTMVPQEIAQAAWNKAESDETKGVSEDNPLFKNALRHYQNLKAQGFTLQEAPSVSASASAATVTSGSDVLPGSASVGSGGNATAASATRNASPLQHPHGIPIPTKAINIPIRNVATGQIQSVQIPLDVARIAWNAVFSEGANESKHEHFDKAKEYYEGLKAQRMGDRGAVPSSAAIGSVSAPKTAAATMGSEVVGGADVGATATAAGSGDMGGSSDIQYAFSDHFAPNPMGTPPSIKWSIKKEAFITKECGQNGINSPSKAEQIRSINFTNITEVRGDGNCAIYSYIDQLLKKPFLRSQLLTHLHGHNDQLHAAIQHTPTDVLLNNVDFMTQLCTEIRRITATYIDTHWDAQFDGGLSFQDRLNFRVLEITDATANTIMVNSKEHYLNIVLQNGAEFQYDQLVIFCKALKVNGKLYSVRPKQMQGKNIRMNPQDPNSPYVFITTCQEATASDNPEAITVYLNPGHYYSMH